MRHCYLSGTCGHTQWSTYPKVPIVVSIWPPHIYLRVPIKIGDVPKSPFAKNSGTGAIGRHNKTSNWRRSAWVPKEPASMWFRALIIARAPPLEIRRGSWSFVQSSIERHPTMTIPRFVNEVISDVRGIKPGWYAMDDVGNFSTGPFSSKAECLGSITQPTYETLDSPPK